MSDEELLRFLEACEEGVHELLSREGVTDEGVVSHPLSPSEEKQLEELRAEIIAINTELQKSWAVRLAEHEARVAEHERKVEELRNDDQWEVVHQEDEWVVVEHE